MRAGRMNNHGCVGVCRGCARSQCDIVVNVLIVLAFILHFDIVIVGIGVQTRLPMILSTFILHRMLLLRQRLNSQMGGT